MPRENYNDLLAFLAIAREGSFTRAAAQLGVSQSALSHTIRALEARLGVRLLTRTTRSVSVTQAGERLVESGGPRFEEIESELAALGQLKDKPAGSIRLTSAEHAANTVLWPKLIKLTRDYPEINVEICVDYGLTDIVAGRYDAGVRLGDQVAKDMIAVRIGPDLRMAVVGSESYLAGKSRPQSPADLAGHTCINLRLPTHGGLMALEFERDGHLMKARVEGQWTFNSSTPILRAALSGFGLAYLPEDMVAPHVQSGALKRVMKSWTPTFPGYHLYYASRRHSSPAFRLLVEALRYPSRGKA